MLWLASTDLRQHAQALPRCQAVHSGPVLHLALPAACVEQHQAVLGVGADQEALDHL